MSVATVLSTLIIETLRTIQYHVGSVGGDPAGMARAQGDLLNYAEWQELCKLSLEYPTLKKLLDTVSNNVLHS